jgi:hypothetical protein
MLPYRCAALLQQNLEELLAWYLPDHSLHFHLAQRRQDF